ncbi:probable demethylmacrocin O-methyltransferase [Coccomyxa sp. Obi]|nr:probable demethylmacrocin O-methyltransferase [Coccomyxa sp. Obi]
MRQNQHLYRCWFCAILFVVTFLHTVFSAAHGYNRQPHGEGFLPDDVQKHYCYSTPRLKSSKENPLWKFFQAHKNGPGIHKWLQYFDIYHRYFSKFVGQEVHMLEIGVQSGGSLDLWRHYFGDKLYLYGVDINPYAKALFDNPPHTRIFTGDQQNRSFWAEFKSQVPRIDIVLDDGGHAAQQQIASFEELYHFVSEHGVYMVEDVPPGSGSFLEYAREHAAELFGHFADNEPGQFSATEPGLFTKTTMGIAFYDMQVVYEKGRHARPHLPVRKGKFWLPYNADKKYSSADGGVDAEHLQNFQEALVRSRSSD